MNKRLIIELQRRTLAEYAVFMTISAIGAIILATIFVALATESLLHTPASQLGAGLVIFLGLMVYLWLHFRVAARRGTVRLSSTALFYAIQGVAILPAAMLMLFGNSVGWPLFIVLSFGTEVALGMFFAAYLFLAGTLCRRWPLSAVAGLALSLAGSVLAYHRVLGMKF